MPVEYCRLPAIVPLKSGCTYGMTSSGSLWSSAGCRFSAGRSYRHRRGTTTIVTRVDPFFGAVKWLTCLAVHSRYRDKLLGLRLRGMFPCSAVLKGLLCSSTSKLS